MNPRNAIDFVRSPVGAFLGFCVLVFAGLTVANGLKKQGDEEPVQLVPSVAGAQAEPQLVETVQKDMQPFNPPPQTPERQRSDAAAEEDEGRQELPPISLFGDTPLTGEAKPLSNFYAPYGRLIPCQLIITVDSSMIRTPIVGLITEDIYHRGRLIIPAGTEVHGVAQIDRVRERIASGNRWTLVWQSGQELPLSGIALDREKEADGDGWGITDGSAGLRGRLIKSDDLAEIKLFAATFLSGAAGVFTERDNMLLGPITSPSLQNAPLKGAQDVLATYAKQILESIQRDGFYVRVPAGKQFYLYVTQTIDRTDATVGGARSQAPLFDEMPKENQTQSMIPAHEPPPTLNPRIP